MDVSEPSDGSLQKLEECEIYFMKGQYNSCLQLLQLIHVNSKKGVTDKLCFGKTKLLFSQWCIQHNILLCKVLVSRDTESDSTSVTDYWCENVNDDDSLIIEQLQQLQLEIHGIPSTKEILLLVMTISYSWLSCLLLKDETEYCRNDIWLRIVDTIQQIFHIVTGNKPSLLESDINTCISLIEGILHYFNDLKTKECKAFLLLCCGISWFLAHHKEIKNSLLVLKSICPAVLQCHVPFKEEKEIVKFCLVTSHVLTPMTDWKDVIILAKVYFHLIDNNPQEALQDIEHIKSLVWMPFVQYLKAVIYYKTCELAKAIDTANKILLAQPAVVDDWLKARICNLLGCCFSLKGKHHIAKEWFGQAINAGDEFHLPLKNLCVQFRLLEQYDREIDALQLLVKATLRQKQECSAIQRPVDIIHIESLYILAKRYLDTNQYELAAQWFSHLITLMEENFSYKGDLWDNISCFPKLNVIYYQAAYVHLRVKSYKKCIEMCQKVIENYSPSNSLESMHLFKSDNCSHKDTTVENTNGSSQVNFFIDSEDVTVLLENFTLDIIALLIRAAAHYHANQKDKALYDLKRTRTALLSDGGSTLKKWETPIENLPESNPKKKMRFDGDENTEKLEVRDDKNTAILNYLKSQIYNNLAVLCADQNHHQEALSLLRIALAFLPGNTDAAYNCAFLMAFLGHKEQALQTWIKFKTETERQCIYLSSVTAEQIQRLEQQINSLTSLSNSIPLQMIISDKWRFSQYEDSMQLGSINHLRQIFVPLFINTCK